MTYDDSGKIKNKKIDSLTNTTGSNVSPRVLIILFYPTKVVKFLQHRLKSGPFTKIPGTLEAR